MPSQPPVKIAIEPDDYHAEFVGQTATGRQFFLTTPFVPAGDGQPRREFIALYQFDADGRLVDARIDPWVHEEGDGDIELRLRTIQTCLAELGDYERCRIEVRPFSVARFGLEFGLIPRPPDDDPDETWWVELLPGNYMAFHEPFDSGEYDT
ncbi:MAG: hypothetical protein JST54_31460 [Deltaproteobacteria bacterium]|nr:hypothetical protein [Deltaproteobacteria bacterium]